MDPIAPPPAKAPASPPRSLGLMRIGGALLALPLESIREDIPCPETFAALPVAAQGLRGAAKLRESVIPVLDLCAALGLSAGEDGGRLVVVLRWEGRLLGLLADDIAGIAPVRSSDLHLLTRDAAEGPVLATHSFQLDGEVATLLDVEAILALPGVPAIMEQTVGNEDRPRTTTEPLLLFGAGALHFGVAALGVDAAVPAVVIADSALTSELCLGVIEHHGMEVPVIDTLRLLGLGQADRALPSPVLVLRFPDEGLLGFVMDSVRDIIRADPADIAPMPAMAIDRPDLFDGVLAGGEGLQHLLLSPRGLRADPGLAGLAGLSHPKTAANRISGARNHAVTPDGEPYLTFVAGAESASPLIQIREILTWPSTLSPLADRPDGVLGLFSHRGAPAPLVCLSTRLGRPIQLDQATARVLLVQEADLAVGFVVQALGSIESAPRDTARGDRTPVSQRSFAQSLLEVGADETRRMVYRVDLFEQARRLSDLPARDAAPVAASGRSWAQAS